MNEGGTAAVIAWGQPDSNGDDQLYVSELRGGTLSKPASLSNHLNPAGSMVHEFALSVNGSGDTLVAWEQQKDNFWQIYKREYRTGAWKTADDISPDGTDALGISLAMNDGGAAAIAWEQVNSGKKRIYVAERRSGQWDYPGFVDAISPVGTEARYPRVAMSDSGATVVAWEQSDGDFTQIYRSHYRNAAWTNPQSLSQHISPGETNASFLNGGIAMAADGECMIVWEQYDKVDWQVFKAQYRDGTWYVPMSFLSYFSLEGYEAANPILVMEPGARAAVVWEQGDGKNMRIYKGEYR